MRISFSKALVPLGVLLCLQPVAALAQKGADFPGIPVDSRLLRTQDQAEEIFERTDYERAFFIYRNELVPIGDKYAQYMVGFMYLTGKGVQEDRAVASAWYRLAAERGTKEFVGASNALLTILDDEQRVRSDQMFLELRKQYSDLALILKAVRKDLKTLRQRTGTRAGGGTAPMTVVSARGDKVQSGADYYRQIEKRLRVRLEYIERQARVEIDDSIMTSGDFDEVERQVAHYLSELD